MLVCYVLGMGSYYFLEVFFLFMHVLHNLIEIGWVRDAEEQQVVDDGVLAIQIVHTIA